MVAAKITTFGGMIPAVDETLLPDTAASVAQNCWLYSGKVIGLPQPKKVRDNTVPGVGRVFRIPNQYSNAGYLFDSLWLEFLDPYTDVVRAPVFGDTHDRYYWVSSALSPRYNTRARIENGDPPLLLGVPSPPDPPAVVPSGGASSITVSRAYVYTWVTEYGEESAPSPPALEEGKQDDVWALTIPAPAPGVTSGRNITKTRIYRTVTSTAGVATYFFVAEIDLATLVYNDSADDAVVTGNEQLSTFEWTPPPEDLQGWVLMPNGILAAWRDNELWFSEPYRPHAWPVSYVQTVEYPVVGLGVTNQTLVVPTLGTPVTASGSTPTAITTSKINAFEPCTSRGSIMSAPEGVYFASPNGLMLVGPGTIQNITRSLITRDKWQQYTGSARFRSARLGTAYYGFGSVVPGVFQEGTFEPSAFANEDYTGAHNGVLIDPMNQTVAFTLLHSEDPMFGIQNDAWSGEVFLLRNDEVQWIDQRDDESPVEVALWRSKSFNTPMGKNFGAIKVDFTVPPATPAQNPVRNVAEDQTLAEDQYGVIRFYADDRLVMTRELRRSGELFRGPSGFKAEYWQFEIEARVKITSVHFATTSKELASA